MSQKYIYTFYSTIVQQLKEEERKEGREERSKGGNEAGRKTGVREKVGEERFNIEIEGLQR